MLDTKDKYRIFECYRNNEAEIARTIKEQLSKDGLYGKVWYSYGEGKGNFKLDIEPLLQEVQYVVLFLSKYFTSNFLDEKGEINDVDKCVTVHEVITIEKQRQLGKITVVAVNVNGYWLQPSDEEILRQVFSKAGILREDSIRAYTGLNTNVYNGGSTNVESFVSDRLSFMSIMSGRDTKFKQIDDTVQNMVAPFGNLYLGRQQIFQQLEWCLQQKSGYVVNLHSFKGDGKSALAYCFLQNIAKYNYYDAQKVFYWDFSANEDWIANVGLFLETILKSFGVNVSGILEESQRARMLVNLLKKHKTLLILDGFQVFLRQHDSKLISQFQQGAGSIENKTIKMLFSDILREGLENGGLLLTLSTIAVDELNNGFSKHMFNLELPKLMIEECVQIARGIGVQGVETDIEKFVEHFGCNAMMVTLASTLLARHYGGVLNDVNFLQIQKEISQNKGSDYFFNKLFSHYIKLWHSKSNEMLLLMFLSLMRKPYTRSEVKKAFLNAIESFYNQGRAQAIVFDTVLNELVNYKLAVVINNKVCINQAVKGYFYNQFKQMNKNFFVYCNQVLANLCQQNFVEESVMSIADMQPMYDAIYYLLNCQQYQSALDLLWYRVYRQRQFFSQKKLGAWSNDLSVIARFFNIRGAWKPICNLSQIDTAWLCSVAAYLLGNMGYLDLSEGLRLQSLDIYSTMNDSLMLAMDRQNLARVLMLQGKFVEALEQYKMALDLLEGSADIQNRQSSRYSAEIDVEYLQASISVRYAYMLYLMGEKHHDQALQLLTKIPEGKQNSLGTGAFCFYLVYIMLGNNEAIHRKLFEQVTNYNMIVEGKRRPYEMAYAKVLLSISIYHCNKKAFLFTSEIVKKVLKLLHEGLNYSRIARRAEQYQYLLVVANRLYLNLFKMHISQQLKTQLLQMFHSNVCELQSIADAVKIPLFIAEHLSVCADMAQITKDVQLGNVTLEQMQQDDICCKYYKKQMQQLQQFLQKIE